MQLFHSKLPLLQDPLLVEFNLYEIMLYSLNYGRFLVHKYPIWQNFCAGVPIIVNEDPL